MERRGKEGGIVRLIPEELTLIFREETVIKLEARVPVHIVRGRSNVFMMYGWPKKENLQRSGGSGYPAVVGRGGGYRG